MTRRAVLNVAVGEGQWFSLGQQRLFDSLEQHRDNSTRLFWRDDYPPGCPTHQEHPYAFKPYAFARALELGFDQVVWLDASCWAIKPLDDLWAAIDEVGWYLEPDGHVVGEWISDRALEALGLTRDEAMAMPLIEGKCVGLDFRNPAAREFLARWKQLADQGHFAGAWTNDHQQVSTDGRCRGHRHDIACGSPIVHELGMRLQKSKRVAFPANGDPRDDQLFFAQGM